MNEYRYEIYYKFDDAPSPARAHVKQKTDSQINDSLCNFVKEFPQYLSDRNAKVKSDPIKGQSDRIKIILQTTDDDNSVATVLTRCLQEHDLRSDNI